jgi:transposase
VSKEYRPWSPEQSFLLPPSPREWLPEGHLAYFVLDVVRELDLGAIEQSIRAKDPRGERPYSPRMMVALLLYGYCVGVFSSRKLERATYDDVAFRVLAGDNHPFFTTIAHFRRQHRHALAGLFKQVLQLCSRAGLSTLGHVSLDGTKLQANASKHKAMSYKRMQQEELHLLAEVEKLLARADDTDATEDQRFGASHRGDELPEDLARHQTRLARIREAREALEKEAADARAAHLRELAEEQRKVSETSLDPVERKRAATRAAKSDAAADALAPKSDDDDDDPSSDLPSHRVPTTLEGKPKDNAQRNFTDPDSRIMVQSGAFVQAYNAQAAVSSDHIIVATGVTNLAPDCEHLVPMLERVRDNCGAYPETFTADSGYWSEHNATYLDDRHIDGYIAVGRKTDDGKLGTLPRTEAQEARWQMHQKVCSLEGQAIYALRKIIPEPVFGLIKRVMGFRRFSMRGLDKACAEWSLVCACFNLRSLFWRRVRAAAAA